MRLNRRPLLYRLELLLGLLLDLEETERPWDKRFANSNCCCVGCFLLAASAALLLLLLLDLLGAFQPTTPLPVPYETQ